MTPAARRLGMFGGAFDPPHLAHVALARAAVEQLGLDELRVFPTGQAWHRANDLTPAEHRLAMARIAFADLPRTVIDDRELHRPGPTYTIDTLRELQAENPGAQLFLVMGEDQADAFTRWREWEEILRMAALCVAGRASTSSARTDEAVRLESPSVRSDLVEGLPPEARIKVLRLPAMPESATEVRERAAAREGIDHLVPPGVASYIDRNHLYQTT